MNRLEHLSDQRRRFVEEYVLTGNAKLAAKRARYKDNKNLTNQACKLRRELFKEINDEVQFTLRDSAPKALQALTHLLEHSSSDSVRFACAKDILDRGGFRPADRKEDYVQQKSLSDLEFELIQLLGQKMAEFILDRKSPEFGEKSIQDRVIDEFNLN
mgnify:CR=1 FL=1